MSAFSNRLRRLEKQLGRRLPGPDQAKRERAARAFATIVNHVYGIAPVSDELLDHAMAEYEANESPLVLANLRKVYGDHDGDDERILDPVGILPGHS